MGDHADDALNAAYDTELHALGQNYWPIAWRHPTPAQQRRNMERKLDQLQQNEKGIPNVDLRVRSRVHHRPGS